MSMALQQRICALEEQIRLLNARVDGIAPNGEIKHNPNGPRTMCPKCGVKPNYYLHVKSCRGKILEKS